MQVYADFALASHAGSASRASDNLPEFTELYSALDMHPFNLSSSVLMLEQWTIATKSVSSG